jgi:hypothetical protein
METPEFLVWAIEYRCPVRGFQDGSDPERTERQLRAARAVSDARRDGRVFEGLCVDPPNAFRIDEALKIYGGVQAVEIACHDCPANALASELPSSLAGCYGIVPLPHDPRPVHEAVDQGFELAGARQEPATQPRWYGLWLNSPLWAELLLDTFQILDAAQISDPACRAAIGELKLALNVAFNENCRVHVRLFPPGRVEGTAWKLAPHCPRCMAAWSGPARQPCRVCGQADHPAPEQKRLARGQRPYFPLDRLLGEQQAAGFLVRYAAYRAGQLSPDRAENRLPPEPPDSLPAG